jgi:two-component system phosphate regulon response regulator PhoB
MEAKLSPSILVVEDDPVIQELLAFNLKQSGYRLVQALDVASAMKHINCALPDLILLDWMLPVTSGIEFLRRLRANKRTSEIPIIMLTARIAERDRELGLDSGADDYITKPFSPRELIARIRAKLRHFMPQTRDIPVRAGGIELISSTHRVTANGQALELSPIEFRILRFLMNNVDRVYSRSEFLDEIWGDHAEVEERTVDVHIRRLRQSLEPSGLKHLVQSVRGVGYRFSLN